MAIGILYLIMKPSQVLIDPEAPPGRHG
jgi:hypothetical protein